PGSVGLDAALHGYRRRQGISAGVLRSRLRQADPARSRVSGGPAPAAIGAILLDIEGATTPITFGTEGLFPYARRYLGEQLEEHASSPAYGALIAAFRDEHVADELRSEPVPGWVDEPEPARMDSTVAYVEWLMDRDRKSPTLKELQGRIWDAGYRRGEL